MNKPVKIALGLASVWPILYGVLFFTMVIGTIFSAQRDAPPAGFPVAFGILMVLHLLTILLSLGLMVFYIVRIVREPRHDPEKRIIWILLLVFAGWAAMPVYWYLYIWREGAWGEGGATSDASPT